MNFATRLDAAESAFLLRELANIEARTYETDYPEIKYARMIPTENGFDEGAVTSIYRQFAKSGRAGLIMDKSRRIKRVDVHGKDVETAVWPIGAAFGYSIYEVKGAVNAKNGSLEQARANFAREAVLRELDEIAFTGHADAGIEGLVTHSGVTTGTAPDPGGGSEWANKTATQILDDLNAMPEKIRDDTNGIETPDTIGLPEKQYTRVALTPIGDNTDKTILEFFLRNQPWIKNVEPIHWLKGVGAGGADRMVAYRRDPAKLKLRNPHGYQQLPPQAVGIEFEIICHMTTAGVILYKPKSVYYLDGI